MFKKLLVLFAAMTVAVAFAAPPTIRDVNLASVTSLDGHPSIDANLARKIVDERKKGKYKNWNDLIKRVPAINAGNAATFSLEGLRVDNASYVRPPPTPAEVEKARVAEVVRLQKEKQVAEAAAAKAKAARDEEANRAAAKVAAEAAAAKARAALEAENKAKAEKARVAEELRLQKERQVAEANRAAAKGAAEAAAAKARAALEAENKAKAEKARVAEELRLQKERQVAEANRAAAKGAAEAAAAKARAALEAENKAKAEQARVAELRNQAANQAAAAADRKRQAEEDAVDQKRKAFRDAQDKEKAAKYAADTKNLDVCGKNQMAYRYEEGKIADKKSDEIQEKVRAAEKEKMARDRQTNIDYAPNPKFDKSANDSQANQLRLVLANNQKGAQDKIRALTNEQTNWTRLQEERIKKWMDDSRYNKKICP